MGSECVLSLVDDDPGPVPSSMAGPGPRCRESAVPDDQLVHFVAVWQLRVRTRQLVVRVVGEIDLATAPSLATALELAGNTAKSQDVTEIVIDLRPVSFVSAAGLRELVLAQQRSGREGIPLHVIADQRAVTMPLRLTGLDRTLGLRTGPNPRGHPRRISHRHAG